MRCHAIAFVGAILVGLIAPAAWAQAPPCLDYPHQSNVVSDFPFNWAVDVDGSHAYVAHGVLGLLVIDISNPASPAVVGTLDTPGDVRDVSVQGNRAYLAALSGGLQIIDVSNPAQPTLAGTLSASTAARCVAVAGSYAYVGEGSTGLLVVDVSNPSQPAVVGSSVTGGAPADVAVASQHAYVADENLGLVAIDVSNPAQPTIVGLALTPGTSRGVDIAGSLAYVADDSTGLQIVDISNPHALTIVGAVDTPGNARAVSVSGPHAVVADMAAGLQVIDVSSAANPMLLFHVETRHSAQGVAFAAGMAYVATEGQALAIDVFAPIPPIRGTVAMAGAVRDLATSGDYGFAIDDAAGLQVIEVSESVAPHVIGSTNPPGNATALDVAGAYAYLAASLVLQVVNVSNPASPTLVGSVTPPGTASLNDVAVSGSYAYVVSGMHLLAGGMTVVNVAQPTAPSYVTKLPLQDGAFAIEIAGSYAYLLGAAGNSGSAFYVVNISNPASPVLTQSTFGYFSSVVASGNRLCIARWPNGPGGLFLYGLSDPAHPAFLGEAPVNCVSVDALGNYLYASTGQTAFGLQIVDISTPSIPAITGALDTPGPTGSVAVSSHYVFLEDGPAGVLVAYRQCDDVTVDAPAILPASLALTLHPNEPNPFRGRTTIAYDLPVAAAARVDVYDVMGRHVRTLVQDRASASGRHTVSWDGRGDTGSHAAAGVYFVRLRAGEREAQRRVTLLR